MLTKIFQRKQKRQTEKLRTSKKNFPNKDEDFYGYEFLE